MIGLKCVVKKLHSNVDNPEFLAIARKMLAQEVKALAKLGKHDQIPRLLAYFEQEREFYLVPEYVRGVTLTNELIINPPPRYSQILLKLALQLLLELRESQYLKRFLLFQAACLTRGARIDFRQTDVLAILVWGHESNSKFRL